MKKAFPKILLLSFTLLVTSLLILTVSADSAYKYSKLNAGQVLEWNDDIENDTGDSVSLYFYTGVESNDLFESKTVASKQTAEQLLHVTRIPHTYDVVSIYNWVVRYKDSTRVEFYPITEIPAGTIYVRDMYNDTILNVGDSLTFQGLPFDYRTVNFYDGNTLVDTYVTPTKDFIFKLPLSNKATEHFGYPVKRWRVMDIETKKNTNVLNLCAYEDYVFADIIQARDLYAGATIISGSVIDFTSLPNCKISYFYSSYQVDNYKYEPVATYRPSDNGYQHIVMQSYPVDVFAWKVYRLSEYELCLYPDSDYFSFNDGVVRAEDLRCDDIILNGTVIEFNDNGYTKKVYYYTDTTLTSGKTENLSAQDIYYTIYTPTSSGFDASIMAWHIYYVSGGYIELIPISKVGGSPVSIGTNVTYSLYDRYMNRMLYVSGTGAVKDFSSSVPEYGHFEDTWLDGVATLYIDEGVTKIGKYAFANMKFLKTIILPSTLTQIDTQAFAGGTALCSIRIPEGVTSISSEAFKDCTNLEEIYLPASLESIATDAFKNCTKLKTIHYGGNIAQLNSVTHGSSLLTYDVFFDGDDAICYLTSSGTISAGTALTVAGEKRYYFTTIADALAATKNNNLNVDAAFGGGNLSSDKITLIKNVKNVGIDKNIVFDLNGFTVETLSVGTLSTGGTLLITSATEKQAKITGRNAFDANYGGGDKSGTVVFDNIQMKGYLNIANHDLYFTESTDAVLNYFTVSGQDMCGSITYDGVKKLAVTFYPEYTIFTSYITPYDTGAKYPNGKKAIVDGAVRYYYADLNVAINDARGYALTTDTVFTDATYTALRNTIATDKITLIHNCGSAGVRGGADSEGRGKNKDGSYYGIHKGIVIDLNGHDLTTVAAGSIPSGQILIIMNSANAASAITDGRAFDDENALGFVDGTVVIGNVSVAGEILVANHTFYFADDKVTGKLKEIKHNGSVYRGANLLSGYVFNEADEKWSCYIIPKDQGAIDTQYPNGESNVKEGVLRYFYVDLAKALAEARAYSTTVDTVIQDNVVVCDTYADKIVLTHDAGITFGTLINGTAGYGIDQNGNYYGLHKGIIIDLNGHYGKSVVPGIINADEVLLITNTAEGEAGLSGAALDDESGTGFCTGKVIYNNIKTTGDFWVAGHEIYLLGNGSYATDGKMLGIYKGAVVRLGGEIIAQYIFDTNNSQWFCYIVPMNPEATLSDYPDSEMYEEGGVRYFFYKDFGTALTHAKAGSLQISDCLDENGILKENIPATDRIVLLKDATGYLGGFAGGTNGFGQNQDKSYYGIHKGIIIDLNGMKFESIAPGVIPDGQVLIITNSSPRPSASLASVVLDDENGAGYCGGNIIFDRILSTGAYYGAQHTIYFSNCNVVESYNFKELFGTAKIVINGTEKYFGDGRVYTAPEEKPVDIYEQNLGPNDFDTIEEYINYILEKDRREREKRFRLGSVLSEGSMTIILCIVGIAVGLAIGFLVGKKKKTVTADDGNDTNEKPQTPSKS